MRTFIYAFTAFALSACASLTPPSTAHLATLPTLEIGQSAPADREYILHIPAGKPIPFKLEVSGSAITQPGTASTFVESRQEVYVYKHWASLDGKTWLPNRQLFKSVFSVGLDTHGGIAKIHFDQVAP